MTQYDWREHVNEDEKLQKFDPTKSREFTPYVKTKGDKTVAIIGAMARHFVSGRDDQRELKARHVEVGFVVLHDPRYKTEWDVDKQGANPGDAPGSVHYQSYWMFGEKGWDHKFGRLCKTIQPNAVNLEDRNQLTNALRNPAGKGRACFLMGFTLEDKTKYDHDRGERVPMWKRVKDDDGNWSDFLDANGRTVQDTEIQAPFASNLVPYTERQKGWREHIEAGTALWEARAKKQEQTEAEVGNGGGGGGGYGGGSGGYGSGGGGNGGYGNGGGASGGYGSSGGNNGGGPEDDIPFAHNVDASHPFVDGAFGMDYTYRV